VDRPGARGDRIAMIKKAMFTPLRAWC